MKRSQECLGEHHLADTLGIKQLFLVKIAYVVLQITYCETTQVTSQHEEIKRSTKSSRGENGTDGNVYTIGQINLGRGSSAALELLDVVSRHNVNCVLGQEPYVKDGRVDILPTSMTMYCSKDTPQSFVYSAVPSDTMLIQELSTPEITVSTVRLGCIDLYLVSCYFTRSKDIEPYLASLGNILTLLRNCKVLIGGDFNAKSSMWYSKSEDKRGEKVEEFIVSHDLTIVNKRSKLYTFSTVNGCENIDITLANEHLAGYIIDWGLHSWISSSDHNIAVVRIGTGVGEVGTLCRKRYMINKYTNWCIFDVLIQDRARELQVLSLSSKLDVDVYVEKLTNVIIETCDRSFPRRDKTQRREYRLPKKAISLRKTMVKLRNWLRKHKSHEDYANIRGKYWKARYEYQWYLKRERIHAFERMVKKHAGNPWGRVYTELTKNKTESFMRSVRIEDKTSNHINLTENVAAILKALLPYDDPSRDTIEQAALRERAQSVQYTMDDDPFTIDELKNALKAIRPGRAAGKDNIPPEVIKRSGTHGLGHEYLRLFNACLDLGYFPRDWKHASVILLRKESAKDPESPKSYRPISLLSCASKLLENMIGARLDVHISIGKRQYGFVKNKCTEDAINFVITKCTGAGRKYGLLVALDISGAFDHAWWPSISAFMQSKKVPGNLFRLSESFFMDRVASYRDDPTIETKVTLGVPQGSILGPKCWNYILDGLLSAFDFADADIVAYADDTALLVYADSRLALETNANRILGHIREWGEMNKLCFNASKSEAILLKGKLQRYPILRMHSNSQPIPFRDKITYLGVVLDDKLSFIPHARKVAARAKATFAKFRRVARSDYGLAKHDCLRTIYAGVFEAMVTYASSVFLYSRRPSCLVPVLRAAQNFALKIWLCTWPTSSWLTNVAIANVLPIELRILERGLSWRARTTESNNGIAELQFPKYCGMTALDIVTDIKELVGQLADNQWMESATETIRAFLPTRSHTKNLQVIRKPELSWFITGHGPFRSYLNRFHPGRFPSGICTTCPAVQDPHHCIYSCGLFDKQREALITAVEEAGHTWPCDASMLLCEGVKEAFTDFAVAVCSTLQIINQRGSD